MKKYILIFSCFVIVFACSKESGSDLSDKPSGKKNKAPSVPSLLEPTNNQLCINNSVNFKWNSSTDPNNDPIKYKLQISKDNQFAQIAYKFKLSSTTKTVVLEKGISYYWRVKSIDSKGKSSSFSSVRSLYTEGEGESNHAPFSPALVKPAMRSVVSVGDIILEWTADDVDIDDTLTFDVYYDTNNPPTTKVSDNQSATTVNVTTQPATDYFWYVVVKDNNGGESKGQVWGFKTE